MSNYPSDLLYTEDHEWVRFDKAAGVATVGITHYAQSELGDIVYVEVETEGESLNRGDVFGTVEAVKTTSELFLPVAGQVIEFNGSLESEPEQINESPYKDGWIIKVKLDDETELEALLNAEAYMAEIGA
ncbi:MAG: glycine cleavage system protein GcvH [Phaeodactylibacter sp.]|nr:glycine cleavage system protein GcvH [Phaeodactylibacter sp.]